MVFSLPELAGQVDRWTGGQVDRWTGGQMDRWTGRPVDRWTGIPCTVAPKIKQVKVLA